MPKEKDRPLTPGDIVTAVFGNDPRAVLLNIGKKGPENKYKKRVIGRNDKGVPVVKKHEFTEEYIKEENAKKEKKKKEE